MAYATLADFNTRYTTKLADSEISSHFLPYASTRLEEMLAPYFTVPFSDNNQTSRDLTIDLAYLLILQRSKEPEDSSVLQKKIKESINALAKGSQAMITTSGEALFGQPASGGIWSNTEQGAPIFDLENSQVNSSQPF